MPRPLALAALAATIAVALALIVAGVTGDLRLIAAGAVAAVLLAGWTDARRPDSVRTPRGLR